MSAIQRAPGPGARTMALGDLVRWRRSQLGLTQEEIAARDPAGRMTQAEISQYEKSKVARSGRQKLERLAAASSARLARTRRQDWQVTELPISDSPHSLALVNTTPQNVAQFKRSRSLRSPLGQTACCLPCAIQATG